MCAALRFGLLACSALAFACARGETTSARPKPVEIAAAANEAPELPTSTQQLKASGQLGPGRGTLIVDIEPASGSKLSEGAPLRLSAVGPHLTFPEAIRTELSAAHLPLRLPIVVSDGATGPAELNLTYYTCSHGADAVCRPERARLTVELDLSGSSEGGEAHLTHRAGS